jgi:AcrR family transcriptional regulator
LAVITEQKVWGGQTGSARVAARRARLLEAGFELIREHGAGAITVREVCKRAQLNPRYFYESFADLDALLVALFDQVLGETVALTLAAIEQAPATAEAKTRAALGAAFKSIADDPTRLRFVLADALGNPALAHRRVEMIRRAAELMADQAAGFFDIPRDDELLQSSTFMLAGGLIELLMAWHAGSLALTIDQLIDHAVLLTVGTSEAAGRLARNTPTKDPRAHSSAAPRRRGGAR